MKNEIQKSILLHLQTNTMNKLLIFLSLILLCNNTFAQNKKSNKNSKQEYNIAAIGFYNLENLFDTVDGPNDDSEFLPEGSRNWTPDKYKDKLGKLATVISQMGVNITPDGLAVMGCAEIENRTVLEDLVKEPLIASRNYQVVHFDSKDVRGIDVGFLYNPKYFVPIKAEKLFVQLKGDEGKGYYTRDILWVKGNLLGEEVHFFVNHWPSRRGGEEASRPAREQAAGVCKKVVDSLMAQNPDTKVWIMGDLNDDPINSSVVNVIGAKGNESEVKKSGIFNPFTKFYKNGLGTMAYQDAWSLFDQIMFSQAYLNKKQDGWFYEKAEVFNRPYLVSKTGKYRGYPFRTFDGMQYVGGYSDHFPTLVYIFKLKK